MNRKVTIYLIVGFAIVGTGLRFWNAIECERLPNSKTPIGDAAGYLRWAERIVTENWIGTETFYQAPLYPYFLATCRWAIDASLLDIRLIQSLLGGISVLAIGFAGSRMFSSTAGVISAAIFALYPPAIFYDGIIQKASLASFLLCAILWLASLNGSLKRNAAIGTVLALLVITRENALSWIPLFAIWIALEAYWTLDRWGIAKRVALFVVGVAIVLVPVAWRNASFGGEWSPTTFQAGPNFYIGNNPTANGLYQPLVAGREVPEFERLDAQRLAETAKGKELTPRQVSKYWFNRSFEEMSPSPMRWMGLMVYKTLITINRFEVPDVEALQVAREVSTPLTNSFWLHFGLLFPLAVFGIGDSFSKLKQHWLLYLMLASMVASVAAFFILGRYRFPLVPILALFAGHGLVRVIGVARERRWTLHLRTTLPALIAAVICNITLVDEKTLVASSFMNTGVAAAKANDIEQAFTWLRQADEMQPGMVELHVNLGRCYSVVGRPKEAASEYYKALQIESDYPLIRYMIGGELERAGKFSDAMFLYQEALKRHPDDPRVKQAILRLSRFKN